MTSPRKPTRKQKKPKVVKGWAALHPDGTYVGMMMTGVPRLWPTKAKAREGSSALARILRITVSP